LRFRKTVGITFSFPHSAACELAKQNIVVHLPVEFGVSI
jgi:hypothetical protein